MALLRNDRTGDVINFPHPDQLGRSVITLNGKELFTATFCDEPEFVRLEGVGYFTPETFAEYLYELLNADKRAAN